MIGDSIGPYITKDQNPTAKGMPMINEIDVPAREVVLGLIASVIKKFLVRQRLIKNRRINE
jgi:hypothetical protein